MLLCLVWLIPFPQLETVILMTAIGTILGVVVGMVSGIAFGLAIGNEVGILVGIVAGITVGLVKGVAGDSVLQSVTSTESTAFVSTLAVVGTIGFGLVIGLASRVVEGSLRDIAISVVIGLGAALMISIIVSGPRGIVAGFIVGLAATIASPTNCAMRLLKSFS